MRRGLLNGRGTPALVLFIVVAIHLGPIAAQSSSGKASSKHKAAPVQSTDKKSDQSAHRSKRSGEEHVTEKNPPRKKTKPSLKEAKLLLASLQRDKVQQGLEQLKEIGSPVIVAPIIARLHDGLPPTLTYLAISALIQAGKPKAAVILTELSSHRRAEVRKAAMNALGELKVRSALSVLLNALDDGDAGVRVAAAVSLGQIGDRRALEPLYEMFERGESDAMIPIAKLVTYKDNERLVGYLENHSFGALKPAFDEIFQRKNFPLKGKLELISHLGASGNPDAATFLRDLLNNLPSTGKQQMMATIGKALQEAQQANTVVKNIVVKSNTKKGEPKKTESKTEDKKSEKKNLSDARHRSTKGNKGKPTVGKEVN